MSAETRTVNKDIFYAIIVLSLSCIVSGTIMVFQESPLLIGLGAIKICVACGILPYTLKKKVGQRLEMMVADDESDNCSGSYYSQNANPYSAPKIGGNDWYG